MATVAGLIEGVWLLPFSGTTLQTTRQVFINAEATPFSRPRTSAVFDPDSRSRKVVQFGASKGLEGTISGEINAAYSVTAAAWRERLDYLISHQEDFTIQLVSPHLLIASVALIEAPLDPQNTPSKNYSVSVTFIEVD